MKRLLVLTLLGLLLVGCSKYTDISTINNSDSKIVNEGTQQPIKEKEADVLEREVYKGLRLDVYLDYPRIDDIYPERVSETVGRRFGFQEYSIIFGEIDERFAGRRDIDLSSLTLDESLPEQVGSFIDSMLGGGLVVKRQPVMSSRKSTFKSDEVDFITINGFDMMRTSGLITLPLAAGDLKETDAPFYAYFTFIDEKPFIAIMIGHDAQELDSEKAVLDDIMSTFRRWEESDN